MNPRTLPCLIALVSLLSAQAAWPADPGLVAHLTFDEGGGSIARDVTGNGHDGAIEGPVYVRSPRGHALRFDGADDLVTYGQVESMNLSGDLTLAVWVKTDSAVAAKTHRLIFGDGGMGVERNLNLRLDGYGYLRFEWADGQRNASLLAAADLLDGTWKHVAVACDAQALQAVMYVDAAPVAEMRMPLPISKAPVKERVTGRFYDGCFQGDLDDLRLYNRALTARQIRALYESQAAVQVEQSRLVLDPKRPADRALLVATLRNYTAQERQVTLLTQPQDEAAADEGETAQLRLSPRASREIVLASLALEPLLEQHPNLLLVAESARTPRATLTAQLGDLEDRQEWTPRAPSFLEPLQLTVADPWQRRMPSGPTRAIQLEVRTCLPGNAVPEGQLVVTLTSRETGNVVARRALKPSGKSIPVRFDATRLDWGAYDAKVAWLDADGNERVATSSVATVLPGGVRRIVPLNNLVSELMNAGPRGLLTSPTIEFMNPRDGWCFFSLSGDARVALDGEERALLSGGEEDGPVEAMRLLPAGRHSLRVTGRPTELIVRAIPALVFNVYPATPQIAPFGTHTWERLAPHTLPNTNMIECHKADLPEAREWVAQGKSWILNRTAPGLRGASVTADQALQVWRDAPGYGTDLMSGMQVDEYWGGWDRDNLLATVRSVGALAQDPAFRGKMWIPFVVRMYNSDAGLLFMKATLALGWPFSIEEYLGEMQTEADDRFHIENALATLAQGWETALPGSLRRAIFTIMYAYLPYCTTNRCPEADFRVHLQMQLQALATQPGYFGLWGVQPYRANYVDQEIQDVTAALLRHYCIEGRTDRLLQDPYELKHVTDPDFTAGTARWEVQSAEEDSVRADQSGGYGTLEGRYPPIHYGDTFLVLRRSEAGPNVVSQQVKGLEAGRRYSLKVISADYQALKDGESRKTETSLSIQVENVAALPGSFAHPFCSARGPEPFSREHPFWMTYHWLQFRATGPTARLSISDWQPDGEPGGPIGQETVINFVELQPVYEAP